MKQFLVFFVLLSSSLAHGGAVNRYSSLSTQYTSNPNRYGTTELDAAFYNPAGLAFGGRGLRLSLDNQATLAVDRFSQSGLSNTEIHWAPICPTLIGAYGGKRWTIYFATGLLGGGGTLIEGSHPALSENKPYVIEQVNRVQFEGNEVVQDARFSNSSLEAMSFFAGVIGGVAYRFNDSFSMSLGGKAVQNWGAMRIVTDFELYHPDLLWFYEDEMELSANQSGQGVALNAGLHWKVNNDLEVGLRGETSTRIEILTRVDKDSAGILPEESYSRNDIPGMVSVGLVYHLGPGLDFTGSFARFFNTHANFGELLGFDITGKLDDAWEFGGGLEYRVTPELLLKGGYLRFLTGFTDETRATVRFGLNGHYINGGMTYAGVSNVEITAGLMAMIYDPGKDRTSETTLEPFALVMGVGALYYF